MKPQTSYLPMSDLNFSHWNHRIIYAPNGTGKTRLATKLYDHADFPEKSLLTSRTISGLAAKSHNSIKVGWTAKEQADNAELEEELNKPGFFKPIFALYGIKKASDFKNKSFL